MPTSLSVSSNTPPHPFALKSSANFQHQQKRNSPDHRRGHSWVAYCGNRGLSLLYDFLCACIITDSECENKQPSLNTFTSFQLFPSFHNLLQLFTTCSFPPFSLYTYPPSEPTEAVKGKRKKYCSQITIKRVDLLGRFLCRADRLCEFSAILFPPVTLDGGGGVLIESTWNLNIVRGSWFKEMMSLSPTPDIHGGI